MSRVGAVPKGGKAPGVFATSQSFGGIEIDRRNNCIRRLQRVFHLTPKEFELLDLLISNPGMTFTRAEIREVVWRDAKVDLRTIDVAIGRLRKSLNRGWLPDPISSVHGEGYMFCSNFEEQHSHWLATAGRKKLRLDRKSAGN